MAFPDMNDYTYRSFTNSASRTSDYHIYAEGRPAGVKNGIVIQLHGDGAGEFTQPTGFTLAEYNKVAKSYNMLLLAPRTPDKTGVRTWWENSYSPVWLLDLLDYIRSQYMIDETKIWFMGYSGGAEVQSYFLLADYNNRIGSGGNIMLSGGGASGLIFGRQPTATLKTTQRLHWAVGSADTDDGTGWNAFAATQTGYDRYGTEGFTLRTREVMPGLDHFQSETEGPRVLAEQLALAYPPSQTVRPWSTVTLTGTGTGTWTQISGPSVVLNGTGTTVTFTAPASMNAQTLVFSYGGAQTRISIGRANHGMVGSSGTITPFRFKSVPPRTVAETRDALVYGSYQPTVDNTGTYGTLEDYNASSTNLASMPASGGVIEGKRIYGDIKWTGSSPLTLKNCLLVGGTNVPTGASAVVDCNGSHTAPITLIDCTIKPREPRNRDCIVGYGWRAYRCNMSGSVDGMGIFTTSGTSADVTAMGNWVHDLTYIYPDYKNGTSGATWHTDGSHNDGAQLQGGSNVLLKGNFFDINNSAPASTNTGTNPSKPWLSTLQGDNGSGVIVQDNTGAGINETVVIEENWFRGGLSQLNAKTNVAFVFRNNKHYREAVQNTTGSGGTWNSYYIRVDARASTTISGLGTNTWFNGPYVGQVLAEPRDRGVHYDA